MWKNNGTVVGITGRWLLLCTIGIILCVQSAAQGSDTTVNQSIHIQLDSFVVRSGFDIKSFIRRIQTDTTFYKAFRSLHLVPFTADNHFVAFNRDGSVSGSMDNEVVQHINARKCRTTTSNSRRVSGDFYKKDSTFNYYTTALFYDLFYSKGPICNETDLVAEGILPHGAGRMDKNKYELKQMIFNPGSKVHGVPMMGNKASIFDADEADKYDFVVQQVDYEGEEAYIFSIKPKPQYAEKVVYNELITWFRRADFSIMARRYSLSYRTLFYNFDVRMQVKTARIREKLYPVHIDYDGEWHVFTRKKERMKATIDFKY